MLYFGQVGSSWGHIAFFGSSCGEKVITPKLNSNRIKGFSVMKFISNILRILIGAIITVFCTCNE